MAPRHIALTENEDKLVDDLVRSGRFRDADEVVRILPDRMDVARHLPQDPP